MKLLAVNSSELGTNTYILALDGKACVIDPGPNYDAVKRSLDDVGATCSLVLLTHGHYDHLMSAGLFQTAGAQVCIHRDDAFMTNERDSLATRRGLSFESFRADRELLDGDNITFGEHAIHVLHTPGHTKGCVCYLLGDMMFSGDTLFCGGIGRTDLPSGDMSAMRNSLGRLKRLEQDYRVYPGHEEFTTLDEEKSNNPYLAMVE